MARVTGIGGLFVGSPDPQALNRWYGEHFGIVMLESRTYDDPGWFQDRGETVFSAVDEEGGMLDQGRRWSLNLRVDDLDGMVAQLRSAGIAVEPHAEEYPNGRFAELRDPDGNQVQLWEPNAASIARDPGPASDD
ncbi:VOC family protein [Thermoleophilia bacterium SCSIO 60948]|nr:VOC family protein [Thermoleophilia bacterium SCSIO 60948]